MSETENVPLARALADILQAVAASPEPLTPDSPIGAVAGVQEALRRWLARAWADGAVRGARPTPGPSKTGLTDVNKLINPFLVKSHN